MTELLSFFGLGVVFGFSIKAVEFVENVFLCKVLSFVLDALLLTVWAFATFSAIIVINNGNVRCQFFIMIACGIAFYSLTVHRLLYCLTKPLQERLNSMLRSLGRRAGSGVESLKKVLHLK